MSQYATISDLTTFGVQAIALQNVTPTDQNNTLIAASGIMDSYFNGRYALPLNPPYDGSLAVNCSYIAAYMLMSVRGFRPTQGSDDSIRKNYEIAIKWCEAVQRQAIHPVVNQSAPVTDKTYQLPQVSSSQSRGWNAAAPTGRPEGI